MKRKKLEGFSLVELLIGMTIVAVLIAIAAFGLSIMQRNSRDSRRAEVANELKRGVEAYYSEFGNYPNSDAFVQSSKGILSICYDVSCTRKTDIDISEDYLQPLDLSGEVITQGTYYCYSRQPNSTYILGIQNESATWIEIGTSTNSKCSGYGANVPLIFVAQTGPDITPGGDDGGSVDVENE